MYGRGLQAYGSEAGHYSPETRDLIIRQTIVRGDYYDVSGTAAAVGRGANVENATFVQLWQAEMSDVDLLTLAAGLCQISGLTGVT